VNKSKNLPQIQPPFVIPEDSPPEACGDKRYLKSIMSSYFDEKMENDEQDEVQGKGSQNKVQKIPKKKNNMKNNSFTHA
jgi:hypothetical protein